MRKQVLSLLVDNNPGVTSRISGLFSRRGYNIDSFSSGETSDPRYTRITIVATGDELILEQIQKQLAKIYETEVLLSNVAVGGWKTETGLNAFKERVLAEKSDLLILGFGMNDLHTPLNDYKAMTEDMILRLKCQNPQAEVLLVATMWPHVESTWVLNQIHTLDKLLELEEKYPFVAVADLTTMHEDIMSAGKRYRDMTANNINHPNDFMIRCHGQLLSEMFIEKNFVAKK